VLLKLFLKKSPERGPKKFADMPPPPSPTGSAWTPRHLPDAAVVYAAPPAYCLPADGGAEPVDPADKPAADQPAASAEPPTHVTTQDGALSFLITRDPPTLRAVDTADGDTYEAPLDRFSGDARVNCTRDDFLRILERAARGAVCADTTPPLGRLQATYELSCKFVRLGFVVHPADPVLDAEYSGSIELPLLRSATPHEMVEIMRRQMWTDQEVLIYDRRRGALRRVHPSCVECELGSAPWWTVVARAPLRLTNDLKVVATCGLRGLEEVRSVPFVQTLDLRFVHPLGACGDLGPLGACAALSVVRIHNDARLTDLGALAALTLLCELELVGCAALTDASALSACAHLTSLDVSGCVELQVLPTIRGLAVLKARGCVRLHDLRPLVGSSVNHGQVVAADRTWALGPRPTDYCWVIEMAGGRAVRSPAATSYTLDFAGHYSSSQPQVAELLESTAVHRMRVGYDDTNQVRLRLDLMPISQSSTACPACLEALGQRDDHGPVVTGRLSALSVDLRDTEVTADDMRVLARWYEGLQSHGAILRIHTLKSRVKPVPGDSMLVAASAWPIAGTELLVPPIGHTGYLVDGRAPGGEVWGE